MMGVECYCTCCVQIRGAQEEGSVVERTPGRRSTAVFIEVWGAVAKEVKQ
jgi:hypothetical protein